MMTYRIKQGKWDLFDCYGRLPEKIEDIKKGYSMSFYLLMRNVSSERISF